MRISLVVSDVDGTLVDPDKALAPSTVAAVRQLKEQGIAFSVISSRPPIGLRMLAERLAPSLPMGAYNGSTIVNPDLSIRSERLIPEAAAREAVSRLLAAGVDVWVFSQGHWLLRDPQAAYTDRERKTLLSEPTVVTDLGPHLATAAKIVGVSADFDYLAGCDREVAAALGDQATVRRSQHYYLDVTPPGVDKGTAVREIAKAAGVPLSETATIGDAANDVAMFRVAGLSIAMGNASDDVKAAASESTSANGEDGFANAMKHFVLPG